MSEQDSNPKRSFRILFKGEVSSGHDRAGVQRQVGKLYGKSGDWIERLFSGQTIVLHRGLSLAKAESVRLAMGKVGAIVHLEAEQRAITETSKCMPPPQAPTVASPSYSVRFDLWTKAILALIFAVLSLLSLAGSVLTASHGTDYFGSHLIVAVHLVPPLSAGLAILLGRMAISGSIRSRYQCHGKSIARSATVTGVVTLVLFLGFTGYQLITPQPEPERKSLIDSPEQSPGRSMSLPQETRSKTKQNKPPLVNSESQTPTHGKSHKLFGRDPQVNQEIEWIKSSLADEVAMNTDEAYPDFEITSCEAGDHMLMSHTDNEMVFAVNISCQGQEKGSGNRVWGGVEVSFSLVFDGQNWYEGERRLSSASEAKRKRNLTLRRFRR